MGVLDFGTVGRDDVPSELHGSLNALIKPHVESFNFFLEKGLINAVKDLRPGCLKDSSGRVFKYWISDASVGFPTNEGKTTLPSECRESCSTYKAPLQISFHVSCEGKEVFNMTKVLGEVPIMVKSSRCNIKDKSPKALILAKEEPNEMGGYFIVNGNEKIIRLLIMPRRNYPTAVKRGAFKNRGTLYTESAIQIRCVRELDCSALTITLHYLANGACMFRFSWDKNEYLIPAVYIFKALTGANDKAIFEAINPGNKNNFVGDRVEGMLRDAVSQGIYTQKHARAYLGSKFRVAFELPDLDMTNEEVGEYLLEKVVFVHIHKDSYQKKFDLLVSMIQKLYSVMSGESSYDNPDAPMLHEALVPGHLYLMLMKEQLQTWLDSIKLTLGLRMNLNASNGQMNVDLESIKKALRYCPNPEKKMENFLATGNVTSKTGLDLQQVSGFVILADKLNFYRYLSHFRCIHRGAFFTEMKTTAVRKLLPEAWGFLCPVHTPDGSPCGLLNHLSHTCQIVTEPENITAIVPTLVELGMSRVKDSVQNASNLLSVMLDGVIVGYVSEKHASDLCNQLRYLKASSKKSSFNSKVLPQSMEITYIKRTHGGLFPGVYLFASPGRMIRPVVYLPTSTTELIGSFEQVYLNIAVTSEELYPESTHIEQHPTNILSVVANMTPFSDLNQSPRNMYQCQMAKQTMGTPMYAYNHRTDNKVYRIHTPQTPMVRSALYNHYKLDDYPLGTNAVVAVISYTGFDMEDAMILNKGSADRGFGHGTVYKSKVVELGKGSVDKHKKFGLQGDDRKNYQGKIDLDGLPAIGAKVTKGDPLYGVIDGLTNTSRIAKYKDSEDAIVDEVRLLPDEGNVANRKAHIKFRVNRNPIIGDKFSSRHGQKGVCSKQWPTENMPFSESGIQPDIIINPHAFPSRMTIGMLVESMAGKSASMHGLCYDSTPFTFSEKETAYDYFGKQLVKSGYNYYGSERLYSGITGTELEVDIFIGVVYYQRLRHMVSDKFQVRTTGPVDPRTRQPVKGRKRKGGIRLGEMERDALLAHGTSYLLQDRLVNCSDASQCYICQLCGSILSPVVEKPSLLSSKRKINCQACKTGKGIQLINVPYVFRYLVAEMYAMNIKLAIELK